MELRQLEALVAVAECRSFTRAAERLGVVQPAVSQAVRRLEDELGVALLERTSRRVEPTAAGAAFLPHARAVLAKMAVAQRAGASLASGDTGVVRASGTAGGGVALRELVRSARAEHPGLRVELRRSRRVPKLQAVLDGELDVALVRVAAPRPGIAYTQLDCEPWCAVVSAEHPLAGAGRTRLAALASDPLISIVRPGASHRRDELTARCMEAGFEPRPGPAMANLEDALTAIATSRAWTLLGSRNAGDAQRHGTVSLEITDELEPLRLWIAHRSKPAPAVAQLLACVR